MRKRNQPGCACCAAPGGCAKITFNVTGCGGLPLPDASVTLTLGGSTVASGTTDAAGVFATMELGSGTYSWSVSKTRFVTETGSVTITCPDDDQVVDVALSAAEGYVCTCLSDNCPDPLPTTLELADSYLGITVALVWDGFKWEGSGVFEFDGCGGGITGCDGAESVPITYTFCEGGTFAHVTWGTSLIVNLCCPIAGSETCSRNLVLVNGAYEPDCNPFVFSTGFTLPHVGATGTPYSVTSGGFCVAGGTTITITEP